MCAQEVIERELLHDPSIWVLFNFSKGTGWRSTAARCLWPYPDPWLLGDIGSLMHPIESRRVQDVVSLALKTQRQQQVRFWCSVGDGSRWMLADHALFPSHCSCDSECPLLLARIHPIQFSHTPPCIPVPQAVISHPRRLGVF